MEDVAGVIAALSQSRILKDDFFSSHGETGHSCV